MFCYATRKGGQEKKGDFIRKRFMFQTSSLQSRRDPYLSGKTSDMNVFHYYYSVEANKIGGMSTESFSTARRKRGGTKEEETRARERERKREKLARLLKDFRDDERRRRANEKKKSRLEQGAEKIQTEKLCPQEAEFIVCSRSISLVFLPPLSFSSPSVHFGVS